MKRIGIISDTHGLLRPKALVALAGVDLILHAGDIGPPHILEKLADIAPVLAVKGNVDTEEWTVQLPTKLDETVEGVRFHLHHGHLPPSPQDWRGANVIVQGHSHRPRIEWRGEVLHINPGSAGPRRFSLPVTLALVSVDRKAVRASLFHLDGGQS